MYFFSSLIMGINEALEPNKIWHSRIQDSDIKQSQICFISDGTIAKSLFQSFFESVIWSWHISSLSLAKGLSLSFLHLPPFHSLSLSLSHTLSLSHSLVLSHSSSLFLFYFSLSLSIYIYMYIYLSLSLFDQCKISIISLFRLFFVTLIFYRMNAAI